MTSVVLAVVMTDSVGQYVLPFHVISAVSSYLCFLVCVIVCIGVSMGKIRRPAGAVSACSAGIVAACMTLMTGAFWGYHAWGAAWVWEPRLTGMLLTTVFFVSWRLACAILGLEVVHQAKMTASLVVLGLPAIAFTHLAVRLFGGVHPASMQGTGGTPVPWWLFGLAAAVVIVLCGGAAWLDWQHWKKVARSEPCVACGDTPDHPMDAQ